VRDIKLVNISLLAKWKWRLLDDNPMLWKEVLEDKYGPKVSLRSRLVGEVWPSHASRWWKNLMGVEEFQGVRWFNDELIRKVGDGVNTFFWKDPWVSNVPLMLAFPRLFSLTSNQDGRVDEFYVANPVGERWNFVWRRELFEWEKELLSSLMVRLEGVARGVVWILGFGNRTKKVFSPLSLVFY